MVSVCFLCCSLFAQPFGCSITPGGHVTCMHRRDSLRVHLAIFCLWLSVVSDCTVFVCRPASDSLFEVTLVGALLEFVACAACIAAFLSGSRSPRSWIGPVDPLRFLECLVARVDLLVPYSLDAFVIFIACVRYPSLECSLCPFGLFLLPSFACRRLWLCNTGCAGVSLPMPCLALRALVLVKRQVSHLGFSVGNACSRPTGCRGWSLVALCGNF